MSDMETIKKRLDELNRNIDYFELEDLCDELEQMTDGYRFLPDLFAILEAHSDFDFGAPGPIVHTAEKFLGKGYEALLEESVLRKPTGPTLIMVRRMANGTEGEQKAHWFGVLRQIATDPERSAYDRDYAKSILELRSD